MAFEIYPGFVAVDRLARSGTRFSELQDRELRDIAPEQHRGDEVRYRATTIGAVDACLSGLPWIVLITDRGTGQAKLKIWFTSTFRISSKRWSSSPGKPLATSSPVRRSEEERWIRVNRAGSKKCVYPLTTFSQQTNGLLHRSYSLEGLDCDKG